jgi:hypothetical protein
MSSKKFTAGLSSLLESPTTESKEQKQRGRPPQNKEKTEKIASFIVSLEHLRKLKAVSYWDRVTAKEVLATALEEYFSRYEKKHGAIKDPNK